MRAVVVPMAGEGVSFPEGLGPRVLHRVQGVPMFCFAIEQLCFSFDHLVLVARREHAVEPIARGHFSRRQQVDVVELEKTSSGPLASVLAARPLLEALPADCELVVANADQVMTWPGDWALAWFRRRGASGGIPTVERTSSRHAYARIDPVVPHRVLEVRAQEPISRRATVGVYWFRRASEFLAAADASLAAGQHTPDGECYVAPVYNHLRGLTLEYPLCEFWSLGEPENLAAFLRGDLSVASSD